LRNEPSWLAVEEVIALNRDAVSDTGEPFSLIDEGALESALNRPVNHWHYGEDDLVTLAVKLLLGIAQDHPFIQGNKRTGTLAALSFFEKNGYRFTAPDSMLFGEIVLSVITGQIAESFFIDVIRNAVLPIDE
jgi:death-on-curing protein